MLTRTRGCWRSTSPWGSGPPAPKASGNDDCDRSEETLTDQGLDRISMVTDQELACSQAVRYSSAICSRWRPTCDQSEGCRFTRAHVVGTGSPSMHPPVMHTRRGMVARVCESSSTSVREKWTGSAVTD